MSLRPLRRLLAAAAIFHVTVAILLFVAGRTQLAPHLIDRDGILTAASDGITYEQDAMRPGAWRDATAPLHVRLLSPFYASLARFRPGILAAEPLNLLCYLAIVALTFAIGREVHGPRVGLIAAGVAAVWPTFVLHTTQLLKDPLFIAGTLALVFILITWLTTTYDWWRAVAAAVVIVAASSLLHVIRAEFSIFVVALVLFGLILLMARQLTERRLLLRNLACGLIALAAALLMVAHPGRTLVKIKSASSARSGKSKALADGVKHFPAVVVWVAGSDRTGESVGRVRERYNFADADSRSAIDERIELRSARDVVTYLPRAVAIGFWAPFPNMWIRSGLTVGQAGRILAGAETAAMYVFEILAVAAVVLPPRRLPALLLFGIAAFGVTTLGMVVSNVGTLYRFRYSFWILLIIGGVAGAQKLVWRRRAAAVPALACIVLMLGSCTRGDRAAIVVTNRTGVLIDALYLSPSDAPTWEENVLGGDVLRNGDSIEIRLDSAATPRLWDLRADGGGSCAEWKRLDAVRIKRITLRGGGKNLAVAELAAR